jgi:hypothetical protein
MTSAVIMILGAAFWISALSVWAYEPSVLPTGRTLFSVLPMSGSVAIPWGVYRSCFGCWKGARWFFEDQGWPEFPTEWIPTLWLPVIMFGGVLYCAGRFAGENRWDLYGYELLILLVGSCYATWVIPLGGF